MWPPIVSCRGRGAFLLSSLLICIFFFGCALHKGQPTTLAIRSDTSKSISTVLLSTNSARRALLRNAEVTSGIVNALPENVKIYIMVNDKDAFVIGNNPWPDRIEFVEIEFEKSITMWPQDPFLVLKDENQTVLLASMNFERASDELMAQKIAEVTGYKLRKSDLLFEGGNIVSDDTSVFIGANTIRQNARHYQMSDVEIALAFEEELGKRVLVVGPLPQPVAHIDMMMTPIGENRLVVADAAAGASIVEKLLESEPQVVKDFEKHCEEYFYGHPAITEVLGRDGTMLRPPDLNGAAQKMISKSKELAPLLDKIAESLETYGYEIHRMPFLHGGPTSEGGENMPQVSSPSFPMLTYNNVLQEHSQSSQRVYVPTYGLSALDRAAINVWEDLGFETEPISGFEISAMYGGALRCAVKVLH